MFQNSQRQLAGRLSRTARESPSQHSGQRVRKTNHSLRTRGKLRAEQLELRQLLTGFAFESVVLTESDLGAISAQTVAVAAEGNTYMGGQFGGEVDPARTRLPLCSFQEISTSCQVSQMSSSTATTI